MTRWILPLCLLLTLSSCAVGRWFGKNPESEPSHEEVKYAEVEESVALRQLFATLPQEITHCFDESFYLDLSRRYSGLRERELEINLRRQLTQKPDAMPVIDGFTLPLRHTSHFDSYASSYQLRTPQGSGGALVLILGELNTPLEELSYGRDDWLLHIPSRPGLNYQLIAEGDLFQTLDDVYRLYPELKNRPLYLVGLGNAGDAALYLANQYRPRFHGVAFSSSRLGLGLPNLDNFPVVHFSGPKGDSSPWGNERLITRLEQRGNPSAKVISGGIEGAVSYLASCPSNVLAPYTFTDYKASQAYPWLRVLGKKTEKEPVWVHCAYNGDELQLEAPNASSVEICASLPKGVNKVRFNGQLYAFKKGTSIILGEEDIPYSAHKKIDTPSGFKNFFCNEPLYIVYQDRGAGDLYLHGAKALAESLSHLKIVGFPAVEANLPLVPLSEYRANDLPDHRAVFVGSPEKLSCQLTNDAHYYPVNFRKGGAQILYHPLPTTSRDFDAVAYGLIYPPEKTSSLKLALLLLTDNEKGLQLLSQHYLSATALYRESDLRLWVEKEGEYRLSAEYTFDSYWSGSDYSPLQFSVPKLPPTVWDEYLKELIISESRLASMVIEPLVDQRITPPVTLSTSALTQYVPERHFATIRLSRGVPPAIIKNLLGDMDEATVLGLKQTSNPNERLAELLNHKGSIVVDAENLSQLTPAERQKINYQLLPYSLHEMLLKRFNQDPEAFGKELIRLGNYIAESSKQLLINY